MSTVRTIREENEDEKEENGLQIAPQKESDTVNEQADNVTLICCLFSTSLKRFQIEQHMEYSTQISTDPKCIESFGEAVRHCLIRYLPSNIEAQVLTYQVKATQNTLNERFSSAR